MRNFLLLALVALLLDNQVTNAQRVAPAYHEKLSGLSLERAINAHRKAFGLPILDHDPGIARYAADHIKSVDCHSSPSNNSNNNQRITTSSRAHHHHRTGNFNRLGENTLEVLGSSRPSAQDVASHWFNEINCYAYGPANHACTLVRCNEHGCDHCRHSRHFTQMMLQNLTHIGCAVHTCSSGATMITCLFGKTHGNGATMVGSLPFDSRTALKLGLSSRSCAGDDDDNDSIDTLVDASELENLHNVHRESVGLKPLEHDPQLAANIQAHLDSFECTDDLQMSPAESRKNVGEYLRVGENLWRGEWRPAATSEDVMRDWFNEVYCYNYGPIGHECTKICDELCGWMSPNTGCITDHFTQLMLEDLTHVGCGVRSCGANKNFVGCHYGKKGGVAVNTVGRLPFSDPVARKLKLGTVGTCAPATIIGEEEED